MLKLKYLIENFELAKVCLDSYEYDEASLDEMLGYFRISSNAVYPFRNGKNPKEVHFLRLSPVEEKRFADVQYEVRLIQWLADNGCPVMEPVPMKNGKLADIIDTQWGRYNVACFAKVPGINLEEAEGTFDLVRGYGKSLGELHNALKRYPAAAERRDYKNMLTEIRERLVRYGAPDVIFNTLTAVERELAALPVHKDNFGIVHFDYEPDNVFFDQATGTYSAIDFDDAIQCWFALDINRALDALDDVVEEHDVPQAANVFFEGYRAVCPFTEADEQTLPLMRKLVLLKKYSTLLHVMSEPVSEEPEWMIELKERLTGRLRWVEAYLNQ